MDMLQKKVGNRSYQKRVFIVTDAGCEVNTDDLNKIIEQFNHMDARLNVMYNLLIFHHFIAMILLVTNRCFNTTVE